jgi:iron complex outermembrane recepter protein
MQHPLRLTRMAPGLRHTLCATLTGLALLQGGQVLAQSNVLNSTTPRQYNLPAGSLGGTLAAFATQAGIALSFDPALTGQLATPGLSGNYTPRQALERLLAGSGLELVPRNDGSYTLRRLPPPSSGEATLAPVTVTAREEGSSGLPQTYAGGQVAKGGRLGLLGNTNFMDTPFNQTSYTALTIEEQQARSLSDLLINEPSVRQSTARTNISEDFSIRGFSVASGDVAFNGMYGLMPYYRVPVEMAERVEVLKGPSSLLNGMPPSGNVGGAINIVPKRAGSEPLTRVTGTYLSGSIFGIHTDIGRRFGANKEFGVRFNGAFRDGDTAIDRQQQTDQVYSLGLDYLGERLRASLDMMYQDQKIDGVVRQFTADASLTALPKAPASTLNYPGVGYSKTNDKMIVGRVEYDISDNLGVYAAMGTRRHLLDALAGNPTLLNAAGDFVSYPAWQIYQVVNYSYEAGADWRFATGPVQHKLATNVSRVEQKASIDFDTFWGAYNSNLYNPTYSALPDKGSATVNLNNYNKTVLTSYALADTLAFLDDRLKLTVGGRRQSVQAQAYNFATGLPSGDKYDEARITPVLGIVVQPQKNLSFYANYIEGLSQGPVAPTSGVSNPGEVFPPIKTKQMEIGSKIDWGRFATTFSLFQIERPSAFIAGSTYGLNGEQRNRGVEFNVFGEVARDVRLLGGLTLMRGQLTKTSGGSYDGNDAVGVPRLQVNLGADWNNVLAPGLAFNGRIVHTGPQYGDQANKLELPAWTRFDVGARYKTKWGDKPLTLRANVENLFDKNYWATSNEGYLYVGSPRTVLISGTVDF